jgi:hypothetical protein
MKSEKYKLENEKWSILKKSKRATGRHSGESPAISGIIFDNYENTGHRFFPRFAG